VKAMLIVFFNIKGILINELVPPGQAVNQKYFIEVLIKLREKIIKKTMHGFCTMTIHYLTTLSPLGILN